MALLITLVIVYFVGAAWPKLVVLESVPFDWVWPIRLAKLVYRKVKGGE